MEEGIRSENSTAWLLLNIFITVAAAAAPMAITDGTDRNKQTGNANGAVLSERIGL
jgi:hypothetical protein